MKTNILTILLLVGFAMLFTCCQPETQPQASADSISVTGNPSIDAISEKIRTNPDDASLFAARATLFYENDGFEEAIKDMNRALSLDSLNADYYHLLADVYLDYFKSRPALLTMERVVELYPERIPSLLKLSEFQLILTKHEESMRTIDRVLRLDPQNADAYFMFGMNFRELGDTVRAINSFQSAVELEPELIDAWIILGKLYAAIGDPLAEKYYDNAINLGPESVEALHSKAVYLADQNRLEESLELYRRLNIVDPNYEEAYFNAGLLQLDLDSLDKAYQQFDLAIKTSPTYIRAYYYRGVAAELKGNLDQARSDYEQAYRMAPNFEQAKAALDRLAAQ